LSSGQRRLAAIMVTDMVGYSSMTQTDEAGAMKLLETHRRLVRPIVQGFFGREIKTLGDGFLIEFGSALEATQCAVEIQKAHRDHNRSTTGGHFTVRIGIHAGDVIHQEGDVYGDAVNIASRIEPLAEPGGICVSEQVFAQVRNKVEYTLLKLPPQRLKNIDIPVEVYKVVLPWDESQIAGPPVSRGRIGAPSLADVKRVKSGIETLDNEIGGGLPEGTVTLVYGAPKSGKSVFAFHFLMQSVRSGEPCLFIMTDYVTEQLNKALSTFGWDISETRQRGLVELIDVTSTFLEREVDTSSGSLKVVNAADLTGLMIALGTNTLKPLSERGPGFRVVLDSLTPLFIYNPPLVVAKFLRQFALKMRKAGAAGVVVTYVDGSVDPQSELIIKASVDNLIHLQDRELVVEGMLGTPKSRMAYQITTSGMKVGF
jgi:class 3 adenylate cyclase/KaiC/GvpD/RAD55 family RecA-like ATPase